MNLFLSSILVSCYITISIFVYDLRLLMQWMLLALTSLFIVVLVHAFAYWPCRCPCQHPSFCFYLARSRWSLTIFGLTIFDPVMFIIWAITLIANPILNLWTKKFLSPKIWFHSSSSFVYKKSFLNCQLWTFQWLSPRLSTLSYREIRELKIYRFFVLQYMIIRKSWPQDPISISQKNWLPNITSFLTFFFKQILTNYHCNVSMTTNSPW